MGFEKEIVLGGQAVIEGVMMKGGDRYAVAVREPGGDIVSRLFTQQEGKISRAMKKTLLVRGLIILFSMLVIGLKALNFSASIALDEDEKPASPLMMGFTMLIALFLALLLFFFLPFFAGIIITKSFHLAVGSFGFNLFEGAVRMGVFLLYVWAITLSPDIRRIFAYHGAEHKVVNAYEGGAALIPEEVKKYSRFHPRCGTSFILFVLLISIIVFSLIPGHHSVLFKGAMRIILLPLVAGISYEVIRLAGNKRDSILFRYIAYPGMVFQRMTTREPEVEQIEVALESLKTLEGNKGERSCV